MERKLKSLLTEIFDSIYVYSPSEYAFGSQRFTAPAETPLAASLQGKFYQYCYSTEFALPLSGNGAQLYTGDLADELSSANCTPERWDFGWKAYQVMPGGAIYAQKDTQARMFLPGEFLPLDAPAGVQAGSWGRAYLSKEDTRSQSGFYVVNSAIAPSLEDQYSFVRFYWNIAPEAAAALTAEITARFHRLRVPYSFKTLRYTSAYGRSDGAVLYVGRKYYAIASRLVAEAYRAVKDRAKPNVPLFAKLLAPGLGFAEDPSGGESFGTSRCRAMAESVWRAYQKRQQAGRTRLTELGALFEEQGWNLEMPHLCLSSVDIYESAESFATL
jgi:hypothetical protein